MLLVVAYLAGRRGGTKAPPSPVAQQIVPASFDLLKELNAHAGRLATVTALLIAATSFSLANGPVHEALLPFNPSAHGAVYGLLILLGVSLAVAVFHVVAAMNPALPPAVADEQEWINLVERKYYFGTQTVIGIFLSLISLLGVWFVTYSDIADHTPPTLSLDSGTVAMAVIPLIGTWVLWQAERVANWGLWVSSTLISRLSGDRRPRKIGGQPLH